MEHKNAKRRQRNHNRQRKQYVNKRKERAMNKIIYKYPLEIIDKQVILLPAYARILTVQAQHNAPYLWALVNPNLPNEVPVTIRMFGTGHSIKDSDGLAYIGTFQILEGDLVFHIFYETTLAMSYM